MIYNILLSIFVALCSFTVNVNSQTCSGTYAYAQCSANSACGCLPLSLADEVGVCAVLGVNCARLNPCRSSDYSCDSPNHICVQHPQCDSRPLCYPLVMVDQRLCPPTSNPPFVPTTTTTTTIPMTTTTNSSGLALVVSNYASSLNFTSQMYFRQNETFNGTSGNSTSGYFFEAIQLYVYESGFYNISSSSPMDTFGYLYYWDFSPFDVSQNLIASDDDSGMERQFSITSYLQAGYTYIVVVTTFQPNVTGLYQLHVKGPQYVNFIPRDIAGFSMNNTTNTTQTNGTQSQIWSALSNSTEYFPGTYKHHHMIDLYITETGMYNITSVSNMDTYGCLYDSGVLSNGTSDNRICDDDSAGAGQFRILAQLEAGRIYKLLFTTFGENVTGQYSLMVIGPNSVYMNIQSSALNSTTTSTWAPVFPMNAWSTYSDEWTNDSAVFMRPPNNSSGFYFQAIELVVNQTGFYNITSSSAVDTFGYLYQYEFYPFDPTINMVNQDDDGAGNGQFRLTYVLQANVRYILVATTFGPGALGTFSVTAAGPAQIDFIPLYSQATSNSTMSPNITNTTQATNQTSLYYGSLSTSSASFIRPGNTTSSSFYYQAVRFSVETSGDYVMSSSSPFDSFGYLYQNRFDPTYSSINLMTSDDDSAGDRQFALRAHLLANINYIVIVTTYNPQEIGSFSLQVFGPSAARFTA